MATLKKTPFELIVNPEDAEPSRAWVLEHIADPDVVAACIMHGQSSDKVDEEFLKAANPNLKTVSTFSVGFGEYEMPSMTRGTSGSPSGRLGLDLVLVQR